MNVPHQLPKGIAPVHARHRLVVDELRCVAHPLHVLADALSAADGVEVARQHHLRLERNQPVEGAHVGQRVAELLAAQREQVRHHGKQGAEKVAAEQQAPIGQPQHQVVVPLGTTCGRDRLEANAAQGECVDIPLRHLDVRGNATVGVHAAFRRLLWHEGVQKPVS